jgi:HEAT repeat protein
VRHSSTICRWIAPLLFAFGVASSGDAHAFVWPNVPEQVEKALTSGDVSERRLAAARLADLPAEIALRLIPPALGDPDVEVRLRVAQAAIARRMPKAGDAVTSWLSEGDARIRLAACDVIRAAPTDRSVTALGRVLGDPEPHVRLAAAAAMGSSALPEAVSPLLGHLDDGSPEVREEVARALGRIGDTRAVVPLIGKVQDSVSDVRKVTARALGDLGDQRAAGALMLALQDPSAEVRLEAVGALGKLRSDEATPAIAPLVDGSAGENGGVTPAARTSSSAQGAGAAEVRAAALRALGRIGSEAAVKILVAALAKDDPAAARSPVRDALAAAGMPAEAALIVALGSGTSASTAAGAALVLGTLRSPDGAKAIVRAMQRGTVPLRAGVRALAQIGSPTALPTVLELFDDPDPTTRKEAIRAAASLLDPAQIDGRAVDPASASLRDASTPIDEKIELVRLLGRTGAPRAEAVLLPLVTAKPPALRLAVIEALGSLRVPSTPTTTEASKQAPIALPKLASSLLAALDDESPEVRLGAAMALSHVGGGAVAHELLRRLAVAAEQDRSALGIAISGALARSDDAGLAASVRAAYATAPESARDALIEGLGRMRGPDAGRALDAIAAGSIDDRRKVAEALAGHAEMEEALRRLAGDADPGVRANAAWSLGTVGTKGSLAALGRLTGDPDVAVAGNAVAALGRIAGRAAAGGEVAKGLCAALGDARPYVRANALLGLSIAGASCEPGTASDLLARDPSESVRLAAADYLARSASGASPVDADKRALVRCVSEEKDARVAGRCAKPASATKPDAALDDIAVYVVSDGRRAPEPRAPFALVRADGLMRLGLADRRGEIFETAAPAGVIRLAVPAALAR